MKVVLITPFPPNIGGGAMQLLSFIQHLAAYDIEITWLYLNCKEIDKVCFLNKPVELRGYYRIGNRLMGGNLFKDLVNCLFLWFGVKTKRFKRVVDKIFAVETDAYWIVIHNEGLLIADEVIRKAKAPVHITIHDDPPYGVFARSRRYRLFSGIAQKYLKKVMASASNIDVTSEEMRFYYRSTLGLDTVVCHPYVPKLPDYNFSSLNRNNCVAGHIGNIYSISEFWTFCQALQMYSRENKLSKFIMIGTTQDFVKSYLKKFSEMILVIPYLPEQEAVKVLSECSFLYAMYPFNNSSVIFRQTSFQTKLGTYIQAQRPIFGLTPEDSTLEKFIEEYKIGLVCNTLSTTDIVKKIERLLHYELSKDYFEQARISVFGVDNAKNLLSCFKAA